MRFARWTGWLVATALMSSPVAAVENATWDQARVTSLAAALHEKVAGMRDELRGEGRPSIASLDAWAYHRLIDNLRLIEQETQYLHRTLASGAGREETLPAYARIAMLRRTCDEEMRKQGLGHSMLARITESRAIVKQMDPYYGFDPEREDHERVLSR